MQFTVYADGELIAEDMALIDLLVFLIANRVAELPPVEAREQIELLTLIQDNAPRGGE